MQILNHMFVVKNLHISTDDVLLELRMDLLHFQLAVESHDFNYAANLLDRIQEQLINVSNNIEIIRLPNQMHCPFIDLWIVDHEQMLVKCLQLQTDIEHYISIEQFDYVVCILLKYRQRNFECNRFTAFDQMEMILHSFWMLDRWDDCLQWCEKGLHDSMSKWLKGNVKSQHNAHRFAKHTQFLVVYLRHLLCKRHACKCSMCFILFYLRSHFVCHFDCHSTSSK